jgi:mono/diheme cytochrome c family protein
MRNACSLGLLPGMTGKPDIITRGSMAQGPRPSRPVQSGSGRWWLIAPAACAILTSGGVAAQDLSLVEEGRRIFFEETFEGNGRTCGTCHPATHNFTIDAEFIRALHRRNPFDPLFVAEFVPELERLEDPELMHERGLILENLDGFTPTAPVFRGVPHNIGMSVSIKAAPTHGGPDRDAVGWSGNGAPGAGTIRDFLAGAITQHFPQTLARVPGDDFRLPTPEEADAVEAFMLSLGRKDELDLEAMSFADPDVEAGRRLFLGEDGANRSCSFCHGNAGANTDDGLNENFDTGTHGLDPSLPPDDGFGRGTRADGTFNTVSLVEAADTPPFFHNNSAETIEDAVEFYTTDMFADSPEGGDRGAFNLTPLQVEQVAAFLRAINARFNLSNSNVLSVEAAGLDIQRGRERIREVIAESEDAIEVLTRGPFGNNFRPLVAGVRRALGQDRRALAARRVEQRNAALAQARQLKDGVAERLLAPNELASVAP